MARFQVTLGGGETLKIAADAVDNLPEFVSELKGKGYVTGRRDDGEPIAVLDPHVATVKMV